MGKHIYIFVSIVQAITGTLLRVPLCTLFPISPRDIKVSRQNSSHVRVRLLSTDLPNFKCFWKSILVIYSIDQKQKMYDFSSAFHFFPSNLSIMMMLNVPFDTLLFRGDFYATFLVKAFTLTDFTRDISPYISPWNYCLVTKVGTSIGPTHVQPIAKYRVISSTQSWKNGQKRKSRNRHISPIFYSRITIFGQMSFFDVITPWPKNLTPKTTRKLISKKC